MLKIISAIAIGTFFGIGMGAIVGLCGYIAVIMLIGYIILKVIRKFFWNVYQWFSPEAAEISKRIAEERFN